MTRLIISCLSSLVLLMMICNASSNALETKVVYPVFFTFGDSYYDVGQSNYVPTATNKANIPPYGETYFHRPTGRFSNGRLIPDFLAQFANLPFAPPVLQPGLSGFKDGVNFACSAAGALNETFYPRTLSLGTQVAYYKKVAAILKQQNGNIIAKKILSKAVYIFNIGGNDYIYPLSTNPALLTPQYINLVIGNITLAIKDIYGVGGRKFAINNVGPLGCFPLVKAGVNSSTCYQPASQFASLHNQQLSQALSTLATQHKGFKYGLFDFYTNLQKIINNPTSYGFLDGTSACCGSGLFRGIFSCGGQGNLTEYELCPRPQEHVFWDSVHLSEGAQNHLANLIWAGSSPDIGPYNVKTFFQLGITEEPVLAEVRSDPLESDISAM